MEKEQYEIMYRVEDTHFWYKGMRKISETLLNKFLSKKKSNSILDAGCGTGASMLFLKKYGKVAGFDISVDAVNFCKKRKITNVKLGSITKIPFRGKQFDLVTCFDVLGQMEVSSDKSAMKEFHRVLKPGGTLLIRIAAYNWLYGYHDKAVHTKHRYNASELTELLKKNNLTPLQVTYANTFLFPVASLMRFLRKIFPVKHSSSESDVSAVHPFLNKVMYYPLAFEAFLLQWICLPFGLSVTAVAIKR